MNINFDPRTWNLLTGVALLTAGCGTRIAASEAGETGETGETADTVETAEGPECTNADDCPYGYGCYDGVCMYYPHHDGWTPYYDCYADNECDEFELCVFGYCELLDLPPQNCTEQGIVFPAPVPIEVDGEVLALTFADVDADGQDELVLATATELLVYEPGGGTPTVNSREPGDIDDMVAGSFDATPGEDVMLLSDESLVLYGSNGDGTLLAPVSNLAPIGFVSRLIAAELDEQPGTDLLGWGGLGAFVDRSGQVSMFSDEQYEAGAVHELGVPEPGIALLRGAVIEFYNVDGTMFAQTDIVGGPLVLAAFTRGSQSEYVNLVPYSTWSLVQARDRSLATHEWVIEGLPTNVFAADIDGDGDDELLYFDGARVALELNPGDVGDCWHELAMPTRGLPSAAVVGDFDGDGDEELAIRTDLGEVVLFDAG